MDEKQMIKQALEDAYHGQIEGLFNTLVDNLIACEVPSMDMTVEKAVAAYKRGKNLMHQAWELANK